MLVEFGHKVPFSLPYFAKNKGVEDGTTTRIIPEVMLVFGISKLAQVLVQ